MSDAFLDYTSWSFQLIVVLAVLYLAFGLAKPAWVMAGSRLTVALVAAIVILLASTAFYIAVQPLPGAQETPAQLNANPPPPPHP
jgi:hypothetical protein